MVLEYRDNSNSRTVLRPRFEGGHEIGLSLLDFASSLRSVSFCLSAILTHHEAPNDDSLVDFGLIAAPGTRGNRRNGVGECAAPGGLGRLTHGLYGLKQISAASQPAVVRECGRCVASWPTEKSRRTH
jgi:hypothetical protein